MERLALERPVTPLSGSHSERRFADAARNHNPGDRRHQPHGRHARWRWGRGSQRAVTTPSGSAPAASPRRVGGLGLGGLFGLVFILAGAGFTYQTIATEQDKAVYPPPGQLVDVGGHRLHIQCVGAGSPTVVTESGLGGTSLDWSLVQPAVAQTTRICKPALWSALYEEGAAYQSDLAEALAAAPLRADMPLVVLLRGLVEGPPDQDAAGKAANADLARRSTRGQIVIAERSHHYIQLERPGLFIAAMNQDVESISAERVQS